MSEKIEPALTITVRVIDWDGAAVDDRYRDVHQVEMSRQPEPDIALSVVRTLLHGQPFGFTWEDVDKLRESAHGYFGPELNDLSDRIAALLPPRETR